MGAPEVAQAVVLLRAHADALAGPAVPADRPQLEAQRVAELPVAVLARDRLEGEVGARLHGDVAAVATIDPLDGAHRVRPGAAAAELDRALADAVDRVLGAQEQPAAPR